MPVVPVLLSAAILGLVYHARYAMDAVMDYQAHESHNTPDYWTDTSSLDRSQGQPPAALRGLSHMPISDSSEELAGYRSSEVVLDGRRLESLSESFDTFTIVLVVLIPFIAGIVGYLTNMLALHMTFYPIDPLGFRIPCLCNVLIGWQGIVPSKAEVMVSKQVDLIVKDLMTPTEIFSKLDSAKFVATARTQVRATVERVVRE